jgi:hypothetical protein
MRAPEAVIRLQTLTLHGGYRTIQAAENAPENSDLNDQSRSAIRRSSAGHAGGRQ